MPERFELGTPAYADLAGVTAAVDHLAGLGGEPVGPAVNGSSASMAAVQDYEGRLFGDMLGALDAMEHVTTYGKAASRTATAYFNVAGHTPAGVAAHLAGAR